MKPIAVIPENPYFTIKNEVITINCEKKQLHFHVSDITKIYLSKNSSYWHQFVGQLLAAPSTIYDLHIATATGKRVCLTITALERYYFIKLIYQLRHQVKPNFVRYDKSKLYYVQVA